MSIVSVFTMLILIDFIFFIILLFQSPSKIVETFPQPASYIIADRDLGYVPRADTSINFIKKFDTLTVYNIHFTIDKYHHRINPSDNLKYKKKYALFFGCSITFGEGVNDSETIPARFSDYLRDYHSYNFGFSGYGTQQMLANLQKPDLKNEIAENEGVGFYIFINSHINRAIGDMDIYNKWGAEMPYYYLRGDSLQRGGSFKTGRWFVSMMYKLLGRSNFLKYYHVNFPFHIREKDYRLVTKMIKESYDLYVSKFHNTDFYVVIFPGEKLDIVPYLQEQHIKVLDYSKLFNRNSKENSFLPYDSHPKPFADNIFAQKLSSDIRKLYP